MQSQTVASSLISRPALPLRQCLSWCLWLLLALCSTSAVPAAPISAEQAGQVVHNWLANDPTPLHAAMSHTVAAVTPFGVAGAAPQYYVVSLRPAGFVIVAGDDLIEPIIAFAPCGQYDPSPRKPLAALVSRDLPARLVVVQSLPHRSDATVSAAQQKWHALLGTAADGKRLAPPTNAISDPRVDPLLKSLWNQTTIENPPVACYNYYTPGGMGPGDPTNDPDGCGPTAAAQLMRYWQYPTAGVGTAAYQISVTDDMGNTTTPSVNLRGGDGKGGPYNWANMPYDPEAAHATVAQCQAIGTLCEDAGTAMAAMYAPDETGVYMDNERDALVKVFQFSNAIYGTTLQSDSALSVLTMLPECGLINMVNPNLDAGFPVLFGIQGSPGGHAIVCDGYGYSGSTLFHHLNMGWADMSNTWYNLPNIDCVDEGMLFNILDACVYNIYPTGSGEIISGRVLDATGKPVNGATVTAVSSGGKSYPAVTTNARGIYACSKLPSNTTYTLTATKAGMSTQTITIPTGTSTSVTTTTGNVWGADFCLPVLTLEQSTSPRSTAPGTLVTWTLTCRNSDGIAASNVQLTDVLPATLHYVTGSASNSGSYAAATNTLKLVAGHAGDAPIDFRQFSGLRRCAGRGRRHRQYRDAELQPALFAGEQHGRTHGDHRHAGLQLLDVPRKCPAYRT